MGETQKALPLHRMIADFWRTLRRDAFGAYRPELHYMRGPGPKWREKHAPAAAPQPSLAGAMRIAA
jgi:hypothetical protein